MLAQSVMSSLATLEGLLDEGKYDQGRNLVEALNIIPQLTREIECQGIAFGRTAHEAVVVVGTQVYPLQTWKVICDMLVQL